jgi:hypothetical protein
LIWASSEPALRPTRAGDADSKRAALASLPREPSLAEQEPARQQAVNS